MLRALTWRATPRGRGAVRHIAAACLLAVLGAAPPVAFAGADPASRPDTIRVGQMTLQRCGQEGGYCGRLSRPLDPAHPSGRTIDIDFLFFPHHGSVPRRGVIVGSEGGPGLATTKAAAQYLNLFAPLLDDHDLLLDDQRGTGRSDAIDCEPLQSMQHLTVGAIGACGASLGPAATLYGSGLAADDLAALLDRLGIPKIDLIGTSYGTFLAQTFAGRHPDRLRSLVLDGAYPVIDEDPFFAAAGAAVRRNLDLICARAPSCHEGGGTSLGRTIRLLQRLRAHPITGQARTIDGDSLSVTLDAESIGNILYDGASGGLNDREFDPAMRALLDAGDPVPLLRLAAENAALQGDAGPGGPPTLYSRGLNAAVTCMDYPTLFDMTAAPAVRRAELAARIVRAKARHPGLYAPLTIAEWLRLPLELRLLDLCLEWPVPTPPYSPGHPIPAPARFADIPTLVLSGELDGLTTPEEGAIVARQFPHGRQVVVENSFHVVSLGDVDNCASRIVQVFVTTLRPGNTACTHHVRPLRMPPPFPRHAVDVPPAVAMSGNLASPEALSLAAAAVQTAGDIAARWRLNRSGHGFGLRGGSFRIGMAGSAAAIRLDQVRWTDDLIVSGIVLWDRESAAATASLTFAGPGRHHGHVDVDWSGRNRNGWALLTGTVDDAALRALIELPSAPAASTAGR